MQSPTMEAALQRKNTRGHNSAGTPQRNARQMMIEDTAKTMGEAKKAAARDARKREYELKDILRKWDFDHSGGLKWDELQAFLQDLAAKHGHPQYCPGDEDIKWMISKAKQGGLRGHSWADWREGKYELDKDALSKGLPEFLCYLSHLDMIDEVFREYNQEGDGHLDRNQLKGVLTQLNDGYAPTDAQLDEVMKEADEIGSGTVTKPELTRAISLWYAALLPSDKRTTLLDEQGHLTSKAEREECTRSAEGLVKLTQGAGSSSCCVLQ